MKRFEKPILVTRPYLPDLEAFKRGCAEIWSNQWLTNNGPMLQSFQRELAGSLGVPETNIALFNNGTLALELGCYAMGLSGGEVITTPFASFPLWPSQGRGNLAAQMVPYTAKGWA